MQLPKLPKHILAKEPDVTSTKMIGELKTMIVRFSRSTVLLIALDKLKGLNVRVLNLSVEFDRVQQRWQDGVKS